MLGCHGQGNMLLLLLRKEFFLRIGCFVGQCWRERHREHFFLLDVQRKRNVQKIKSDPGVSQSSEATKKLLH